MKLTVNVLDEVELAMALDRSDNGWNVRALFVTFNDRSFNPHVSVFAEPQEGYLTPHFTAAKSTAREFRRRLDRIKAETLYRGTLELGAQYAERQLAALEPTTPDQLEKDRFVIHVIDPAAVRRWIRRGHLSFNAGAISSFGKHLLRRFVSPSALVGIELDAAPTFIITRPKTEGFEFKVLSYFPFDFAVPRPGVSSQEVISRAGWYLHTPPDDNDSISPSVLTRLGAIHEKVKKHLLRYPRKSKGPVECDARVEDDFSRFSAFAFGLYMNRFLDFAIEEKLARLNGLNASG